ncbi:MAG TPA: dTDP-4-dehydrorhamnose 3,5-epimerase [Polyangiaceae bacterium]|nr:dTDP-4-dehydrorhamnose 3,5-epimerase [Polyangiaceae bacterium]
MNVTACEIPDVLLIEPRVFRDTRGHFTETWTQAAYAELGLPAFVQENVTESRQGVVRGLHLQHPFDQAKLVSVHHGEVFDVVVDVRAGSPSFGRWLGSMLSADNGRQLFIPVGFAHGFCVTSSTAVLAYKCSDVYRVDAELGIRYDDPDLAIPWPRRDPVLSDKDRALPRLQQIDVSRLPRYTSRERA